jgi:transcriptional regulator GlxA family with amidase domain
MRTKPYATAIVIFEEVELLDVTGPLSVLSAAGRQWNFQPFKVELVASKLGRVSTRSGLSLDATRSYEAPGKFECLIVPGGYGARRAAEQNEILDFVRGAAENAEWIAAIGNGACVLGQAGLLDGVEVAATHELSSELSQRFPTCRPNARDAVCRTGKILSARASALGLDLACEIVARTFGNKLASSLSAALGIDWSGELAGIEILLSPLVTRGGGSTPTE